MYSVDYRRPKTLAAAIDMLQSSGGKPLAGGQSLIGAMKLRLAQPGVLVDLGAIDELRGIRREGNSLIIGSMTRHAEVAEAEEVRFAIPALAALASQIADCQVRNMGTLGGSLASNDPAADYPAGVLALGATIHTSKRCIPADEFFVGMYETALDEAELITAVEFPIPKRAAYVKFEQPASGYALVGVFVADGVDGVRVAVTGASSSVFRVGEMERALAGSFTPTAARSVVVAAEDMSTDLHGSAEYRAHLVSMLAARAVAQALDGNGGSIAQPSLAPDRARNDRTSHPAAPNAGEAVASKARSGPDQAQGTRKKKGFAMEMSGTRIVPDSVERTYEAILDPEFLKECVAGCESIERLSEHEYRAVAAIKIGPVGARFTVLMTLSELDPPHGYLMTFEGQGGAAGFGKGRARVTLTPDVSDVAATSMHYEVEAQVGGKLAQIGSRLIDGAARKLTDDFFARFVNRIARQNGAPMVSGAPIAAGGKTTKSFWRARKTYALAVVVIAALVLIVWLTMRH